MAQGPGNHDAAAEEVLNPQWLADAMVPWRDPVEGSAGSAPAISWLFT